MTPDGAEWAPRPRVENAMVKALARAFRWRKMLDDGVHATLEDLARAKGVNGTYVSRILRLTLLAPELVEAILDGPQPEELQLDDLLTSFPLEWEGQRVSFRGPTPYPARSASRTDRRLSTPASRFSMISSASSSGSGRLSRSVRLLSFSQKTSRLVLSRASQFLVA